MPGHAAKSTPMYDDNPSLKGGQSRLPDVVQKAIIKKKAKGLKEKEKVALILSGAIGALSAEDPVRGAVGGVGGGVAGGLVGQLVGAGLALPVAMKLVKKNPEGAAIAMGLGRAGVGLPAAVYGAYRGGQYAGGKKKKASAAAAQLIKQAAHGAEYDDSHMLCKSLERTAAQAMHLKEKIQAGLVLPSWAEYKIYKAYDSVNSALGASYPGHYPMGMGGHMTEKQPSPMIVKAAAHCMGKHKKKKKPVMKKKASVEQEVLNALTDEGGAAGMGAIKKRVSSPELAAAVKRLMAQGKIHKHRDGDIIKK